MIGCAYASAVHPSHDGHGRASAQHALSTDSCGEGTVPMFFTSRKGRHTRQVVKFGRGQALSLTGLEKGGSEYVASVVTTS